MLVADILDSVFGETPEQSLIIGLGNSLRCDDGVGPFLASELQKLPFLKVENVANRPERSMNFISEHQPRQVVFFDAADFSATPGTLQLIDRNRLDEFSLTSHRLPLVPMLEWIEFEYGTPCQCLGIQPASLQLGGNLSPEIEKTARVIIAWFRDIKGPVL